MTDNIRHDFELWALDRGWGVHKKDGFYEDMRTHDAWSAWLASRCAIRVDLPHLFPFYRQAVTEALLGQGIKVNQWGSMA